ncbi:universal stress protein [Marinicella meishanensis]|uniref:universal stress protein n=1 Tax=Marinicella meishanensis TaxID=2873263 RepID=UPI001CC0D466|nr:universal stress protein [Marinicella sp. NBU2979]
MKNILIPVSDTPECGLALEQGFKLSQLIDAHVTGCHIRPHADSAVDLDLSAADSLLHPDEYDLAWEATLQQNPAKGDQVKARALFEKMAQAAGFEVSRKPRSAACAIWTEKVGSPDKLFSIWGPVSDLIVVSRPNKKGHSVAKTFMDNAVLKSACPVLLLPQTPMSQVGQHIAIAWNQSPEAAAALKAAMPLLLQAKQVCIITHGPEDRLGPKTAHLQAYLAHWGITADHHPVKQGNDQQAILAGYQSSGADLLVMGAYSRSRLRQQIFGGVTQHMLDEADIPVFMLHR